MSRFGNDLWHLTREETQQLLDECLVNLGEDAIVDSLEKRFDDDGRIALVARWLGIDYLIQTGPVAGVERDGPEDEEEQEEDDDEDEVRDRGRPKWQ